MLLRSVLSTDESPCSELHPSPPSPGVVCGLGLGGGKLSSPKSLSTLLSDQGEAEVCQNPRCWTAPSPRKGLLEENGRGWGSSLSEESVKAAGS